MREGLSRFDVGRCKLKLSFKITRVSVGQDKKTLDLVMKKMEGKTAEEVTAIFERIMKYVNAWDRAGIVGWVRYFNICTVETRLIFCFRILAL